MGRIFLMEKSSKEENWFRRHWIVSIFLCIMILGMFGALFGEDNSQNNSDLTGNVINENSNNVIRLSEDNQPQVSNQDGSLITKSPNEMLPLSSELPTEYTIGEKKDITKESEIIVSKNAQEGFDSGKTLLISQYKVGTYTVTDYIEVTFGIYKFDNPNYASNFKNKVMNEIKSEGGYTELSISSECFAWKQDYGYEARFGESICNRENIIFWTSVTLTNSFKQPDNILEDMTQILDRKI